MSLLPFSVYFRSLEKMNMDFSHRKKFFRRGKIITWLYNDVFKMQHRGCSYPSSRQRAQFEHPTALATCQSPSGAPGLKGLLNSPSTNISRTYYYLQNLGVSTSRKLLADSSDLTPVPSPLIPVLPLSNAETEMPKAISKRSKVQAVLKGIKQSPKKVNLVAALVRGMRVEDALLQLQVTVKRAAKTVYQVIHSARANATHNHGLDPDRLLVAEAFVGKGFFKKRVSYHSKGRSGIKVRPECRLTVVVREITPEEEVEIARLRVSNFRKLTKRERRLVPHQLIETTPIWNRKGKADSHASATAS